MDTFKELLNKLVDKPSKKIEICKVSLVNKSDFTFEAIRIMAAGYKANENDDLLAGPYI